jgi:hypothetical protein
LVLLLCLARIPLLDLLLCCICPSAAGPSISLLETDAGESSGKIVCMWRCNGSFRNIDALLILPSRSEIWVFLNCSVNTHHLYGVILCKFYSFLCLLSRKFYPSLRKINKDDSRWNVHFIARNLWWDQNTAEANIDGKTISKIRRSSCLPLRQVMWTLASLEYWSELWSSLQYVSLMIDLNLIP